MWLFLVTEVMFFGGLLMAYLLYRVWYPEAWAEGSRDLDILLGGINTAVLIGSSLTMALAVRAASDRIVAARTVGLAAADDGVWFDVPGVKFFEYAHKFELHHVPGSTSFTRDRTPTRSSSSFRCTFRSPVSMPCTW